MAKQSAYLQRREAELDATFNAGAAMAMQFAMDTLQIALHQTEGWATIESCGSPITGLPFSGSTNQRWTAGTRRRTSDRSTWIGCLRRSSAGRQS